MDWAGITPDTITDSAGAITACAITAISATGITAGITAATIAASEASASATGLTVTEPGHEGQSSTGNGQDDSSADPVGMTPTGVGETGADAENTCPDDDHGPSCYRYVSASGRIGSMIMEIIKQGARARTLGRPRDACPYPGESRERRAWFEGFDGSVSDLGARAPHPALTRPAAAPVRVPA